MTVRGYIVAALFCVLMGLTGRAYGQFTITIRVNEMGQGTLSNSTGFNAPLPFGMRPDPGPGGLASAATYDLLSPPGLTAGDLILLEPVSFQFSDLIRFNPSEIGPGGGTGALVFYSDNFDGGDAAADTGFPTALYPNNLTVFEAGPEGNNGFTYTPIVGQPGFVASAGGPVTYVLVSDVPEPASIGLLGSIVGALMLRRRALPPQFA